MIYKLTYTDDLPAGFNGMVDCFFVKIRPAYKSDNGLLQHELTHVKQFWGGLALGLLWLSLCLMLLPLPPRLQWGVFVAGLCVPLMIYPWVDKWLEVFAYRKQLTCYPEDTREQHNDRLNKFAAFMATPGRYPFSSSLTVAEAVKLITA